MGSGPIIGHFMGLLCPSIIKQFMSTFHQEKNKYFCGRDGFMCGFISFRLLNPKKGEGGLRRGGGSRRYFGFLSEKNAKTLPKKPFCVMELYVSSSCASI